MKATWTCPKCPQTITVFVRLAEAPTHHCPVPESSTVRPFELKERA